MADWRFGELPDSEPGVDPIQGEFFVPEGEADALMRECIQNSLDARADGQPVRLRVYLSGEGNGALPSDAWIPGFTEEMWAHLKRCNLPDLPRRDERVPFLVVEDFGTRGLDGNPDERPGQRAEDRQAKNHFYWFWRNWGRSSKAAGDRGRWGVGKTVFPAASRANTFLGLTCTRQRGAALLGQCVVKVHHLENRRFSPYGYWAEWSGSFPGPVCDRGTVVAFQKAFRLRRESEHGLSVVIPFYRPDRYSLQSLAISAVQHFFHPLVLGHLQVSIEDSMGRHVGLDATSLDSQLEGLADACPENSAFDARELARVLALLRWSRSDEGRAACMTLSPAGRDSAPDLATQSLEGIDLDRLRNDYFAGRPLHLKAPVFVHRKDHGPRESFLTLVLQHDSNLRGPAEYYIREGLTIPDMRGRVRHERIRGLVLVDDRPLSELLGDSENPAHRRWEERSPRLAQAYIRGASTVRFAANALRVLCQRLVETPDEDDLQLLADVFAAPTPEGRDRPVQRPGVRRGEESEKPDPDPKHTPSPIRIAKVKGGVRVTGVPGQRPPRALDIRFAYDVRRGNAFSKYSPHDFVIGRVPIVCSVSGGIIRSSDLNHLRVDALADGFEIEVSGFDVDRDLVVKTSVEAT